MNNINLLKLFVLLCVCACTSNTPGLKTPVDLSTEKPVVLESQSKRLYVNQKSIGKNNGNSWEDAYLSIHDALEDSRLGKSIWEIWVAKGNYFPAKPNPKKFNIGSFVLQDGVALYGGFRGDEVSVKNRNFTENETVLTRQKWSEHIMIADSLSMGIRIDGFTIKGGTGEEDGAGLLIIDTPFAMSNCLIQDNHVSSQAQGGGISIHGNAPITIEKTVFKNNIAGSGGAIHLTGNNEPIHIQNCQFIQNQAINGPGGAILLDAQSSGANIENFNLNESFFFANESIMAMGHAIHGNANSKWDITPHYKTEGEMVNNVFWGSPDEGSLISLSQNDSTLMMSKNIVENLQSTGIYTEHQDSIFKILKGNTSKKPENLQLLIGVPKSQLASGKIDFPLVSD